MSPDPKYAFNVDEAVYACGFSRTTFYEEVAKGKIRTGKIGGRTVVLAKDLEAYIKDCFQPPSS
jgi:predicted DNA-binding transcriptional regulator AlpA